MKYLLTDVDGVTLSWLQSFIVFCNKKLNKKVKYSEIEDYRLELAFDVAASHMTNLINEFNEISEDFGNLVPIKWSGTVLPKFASNDYRIVAITACSDKPEVHARRIMNLANHFGNMFEDVLFCPLGGSKTELLKKFSPTIWVEDNPKGANEGIETGHKTFLINQFYNKNGVHEDVTRVNDWRGIWANRVVETC